MSNNKQQKYPWFQHYTPETKIVLEQFEYSNLADMIVKKSKRWSSIKAYTTILPNGFKTSLTYQQISNYSDDFSVYLKEVCQLNKGDRVAIQLPNCFAYPICTFGILKSGCVVVNTNPLYTPSEMLYQFSNSGIKALIVTDVFAEKVQQLLSKIKIDHIIVVNLGDFFNPLHKAMIHFGLKYIHKKIKKIMFPHTKFSAALKIGNRLRIKNNIDTKQYWDHISLNDLAALQYTGGTTGISKGAMLSHKNLLSNMHQIMEMGKQRMEQGKEIIMTIIPLYHIFAFTLNLLTFYAYGGTNVLIPNPKPIRHLKKAFKKVRVSWISGVNTLFNALLNEPWFQKNPPLYLKTSISGGAALHASVAERWLTLTKSHIVSGFGLTEAAPVVTFNVLSNLRKLNTVGIPVPETEVIILNDNYEPVPAGTSGEIAIRGPQVMQAYWQNPEETKNAFRDGWLLTGDIGHMDEEGYLTISDRKKDMILVSGFNVYPNEVEDCLTLHPGIEDAAVIGVPDNQTGESVKAFVIKRDPEIQEQDIIKHCKKFLTGYKVPRSIEFRSDLPKTPIGKVLRKQLRS